MRNHALLIAASGIALGIATMAGGANAGDDNKLFINQIGNNNFATGNQDASGAGSSDNETFIQQQQGNTATVPIGESTAAFNNDVLVLQETVANHAGAGNAIEGNNNRWVAHQMTGNRNIVFGPIWDNANNSTFAAVQDGSNNVAAGAAGDGPFGTGVATGASHPPFTNSFTDVTSTLSAPIPGGVDTIGSRVRFDGNNNLALLNQDGNFNRFAVEVTGSNNTIVGRGAGLASYDMNANASGFFDSGAVLDESLSQSNLPVNGQGFASQIGDNNVAHYAQLGDSNLIRHDQVGNNNEAQIYQQGNQNVAGSTQ